MNFSKKLTTLFLIISSVGFGCSDLAQTQQENLASDSDVEQQANTKLKQPLPKAGAWYTMRKFVDGDTFWIDDSTETGIKVRLIGMDTPESRNVFKKKKHPMGKEVSRYVETLLTSDKVRLELDVQPYDQYGRVLAYVFLQDGTHLNAHLIEKGYAWLMTVPPNVKFADTFYALQVKAREQKRGLWDGTAYDEIATDD